MLVGVWRTNRASTIEPRVIAAFRRQVSAGFHDTIYISAALFLSRQGRLAKAVIEARVSTKRDERCVEQLPLQVRIASPASDVHSDLLDTVIEAE